MDDNVDVVVISAASGDFIMVAKLSASSGAAAAGGTFKVKPAWLRAGY